MSYDGTMTRAVVWELEQMFQGGKVGKIYQPSPDELLIHLRRGEHRGALLISASGNKASMYLTTEKREMPKTPSPLTMLFRKHLESSTILSVEQVEMDRVIHWTFETVDELFDRVKRHLYVELMGRHSNVILTNDEGIILDALKRVGPAMSRVRQVLPGMKYTLEGIITKENPLTVTEEEFLEHLDQSGAVSTKNFLIQNYMGLSPVSAREISFRSGIDEKMPITSIEAQNLWRGFQNFMEELRAHRYRPQSLKDGEKIVAFAAYPLTVYPEEGKSYYDRINELLDATYHQQEHRDVLRQTGRDLMKNLETHLERARKKQQKLSLELRESKDRDRFKVYADVLSANSYRVSRGDAEAVLENFYQDMEPITIPLDIRKDAIQNAAHYYKKYSKLKNAQELIGQQMEENRVNIQYLESLLYAIDSADTIEEIRELKGEFRENFLKKRNPQKGKKHRETRGPIVIEFDDEHTIRIGRNNRQNEQLTLKEARKNDLWFHVKSGAGSHVLLSYRDRPSEEAMIFAAQCAAYFSAMKNSANVEVDYTFRRYIKRHPANKPGLVLYTDFKTVAVTPKREVIEKHLNQQ
ncbi:MAG: NFACT RNA binding domain-containing protein [Tissierellia bacterium]|nr:NFACT RNA binding domain-containing protein [Tissierellia bacterium]